MLPLADKNVQIFRPTFVLPRPSQPGLACTVHGITRVGGEAHRAPRAAQPPVALTLLSTSGLKNPATG